MFTNKFWKKIFRAELVVPFVLVCLLFSQLNLVTVNAANPPSTTIGGYSIKSKSCLQFSSDNLPGGIADGPIVTPQPSPTAGYTPTTQVDIVKELHDQAVSCDNCSRNLGAPISGGSFWKLFYLGFFIPVVPSECTGTLPLSLLIRMIIRVYAFIASVAINLLVLALLIIAIRWVISGLGSQNYQVMKEAQNTFIALFIILIISTLIFELLRTVGFDESALQI